VKAPVIRNGEERLYNGSERNRASFKCLLDWNVQGKPSIAKMNTSADVFP
jgi:hypothetical protein